MLEAKQNGGDFEGSGSLIGRLKGYLKNKKQPAHLENKVQAAFDRANHALTHVFR